VCRAGFGGHGGEGGKGVVSGCAKPDPVGKSAISGVRGLRWVGKGDRGGEWLRRGGEESLPSWDGAPLRDWRSTENALAMEIGEHRGAAAGGARRQNRAP
jgi:hypothetical protein